jgi:cell division protein FtsZ
MPNVQPSLEMFAKIRVIGVGGSGLNAVNHMINAKLPGIEFICINTDTQDLHHSKADRKIHIGRNLTKGLGSGMNPEVGRRAAEETKAEVQEVLKGSDMIFIACGMGGGTGTGASPVVARLAKEQGILTIGVVTRPFGFEGEQRQKIARDGIEELQKEVDALIVISNDRLLSITDRNTSFKEAFSMCDEVLLQSVRSISEIIREKQAVNIDFADIRAVLSNAGSCFIGIGQSSGENRAQEAAMQAINSPLLDVSISGAKGVLLSIAAHPNDLKIHEVSDVARIITESIDSNAKFIFGPVEDDKIKKGELKVTVIATGFNIKQAMGMSHKEPSNTIPITPQRPPRPAVEPMDDVLMSSSPAERPSTTHNFSDFSADIEEIDDTAPGDDDWSAVPAFLRRKK